MQHSPTGSGINRRLGLISQLIDEGPDKPGTLAILELIGISTIEPHILDEMVLYSEYLPKADETPFSQEQRHLQFLWDAFERSPRSLATNFAIPFRRLVAKKLFRACGKNFSAEANIRFNFGQFIEAGDDVFINAGVFIDSKGGVVIGNAVGIGEFVRIFTHTHSESVHTERMYAPVVIKDYAKVYTGAMLFPGVTVGEEAIVAGGAVVTKDVEPGMVVAGVPARVIRPRKNEGRHKKGLDHIWLARGAFQDE